MDLYDEALSLGRMADLDYLERHRDMKEDATKLRPWARSAFVVTKNYVSHPYPPDSPSEILDSPFVAAYARGRDYHLELRQELNRVVEGLKEVWPGAKFLVCTDSAPVLERDLAVRAGLGWIGKNACLLDRDSGSLNLIAEILCSETCGRAEPPDWSTIDFCGSCTRCMDACPTQALVEPRRLDARRCISYWTIEAKENPPEEIREKMGEWLFGCDICQTVCPWNLKTAGAEIESWRDRSGQRDQLLQDVGWILRSSNSALERTLDTSPLLRRSPWALKRNALRVAGARHLRELRNEVARYVEDPKLAEMAGWALARLES